MQPLICPCILPLPPKRASMPKAVLFLLFVLCSVWLLFGLFVCLVIYLFVLNLVICLRVCLFIFLFFFFFKFGILYRFQDHPSLSRAETWAPGWQAQSLVPMECWSVQTLLEGLITVLTPGFPPQPCLRAPTVDASDHTTSKTGTQNHPSAARLLELH